MNVTLFMATSLNGLIARPDYREDFLSRRNWDSFLDCARRTGALIWGRKTHEKFRRYGRQYFQTMNGLRKVVVSTDRAFSLEQGFELAGSPSEALAVLQGHGLQEATLAGGSILNTSFAKEQLIDAVEINIEPVVVGRGIPLFAAGDFDLALQLADVRQLGDGLVQLRYVVRRDRRSHSGTAPGVRQQ
jgi:dihydrofolate reductase